MSGENTHITKISDCYTLRSLPTLQICNNTSMEKPKQEETDFDV